MDRIISESEWSAIEDLRVANNTIFQMQINNLRAEVERLKREIERNPTLERTAEILRQSFLEKEASGKVNAERFNALLAYCREQGYMIPEYLK